MNLAPDAVTLNFQELGHLLDLDVDAMMSFRTSVDTAVSRYRLFLNITPYYEEIFDDAAHGFCLELEQMFSRLVATDSEIIIQLYHISDEHRAYVHLMYPSIHNCKRRLFKYPH